MRKTVHFKCHVPNLLKEVTENALVKNAGVLRTPLNVFRNYLGLIAQRAAQIDDPELNILMLETALYEGTPSELSEAIEQQKKRIKQ